MVGLMVTAIVDTDLRQELVAGLCGGALLVEANEHDLGVTWPSTLTSFST